MRAKRTYNIISTALMAAIIVVCSWITIPFGSVPFTMQTFAVFAAALILGPLKGVIAVVLYLLLGIVGLPVFSAFQAGPGVLMGATGGFLLGFIFIPLVGGLFDVKFRNTLLSAAGLLFGLILCYVTGTLWYAFVWLDSASVPAVITTSVLPYVIPDIIKCILALVVAKKVNSLTKGRLV